MQPYGFGKFGLCSSECPHLPSDYDRCLGVILHHERLVDP